MFSFSEHNNHLRGLRYSEIVAENPLAPHRIYIILEKNLDVYGPLRTIKSLR